MLKVAGLLLKISSQSKKATAINGCSPERVPEEIPALGIIPMIEAMIADKGEERENGKAEEKEKERAKEIKNLNKFRRKRRRQIQKDVVKDLDIGVNNYHPLLSI